MTMVFERSLVGLLLVAVVSCSSGGGQPDGPTKQEVATGKTDDTVDWCEEMGWYGDGVCDSFCHDPDPDCAEGGDETPDGGIDGGTDAGGDGGDDAGFEWDFTLSQLEELTAELVTAKYEHSTKYMGWAHYSNNCFIRMRAVYYYLNFGELPQYDEMDEVAQREMMERIRQLDHSVVYEIGFIIAGSLRLQGDFETDDPELQSHLNHSYDTVWMNHHAALVYTDSGPRVVDIAFSHIPIEVESWKTLFLPVELANTCAMNDEQAKAAISNYNIMKSLGQNPPLPDPQCAFEVVPIFRTRDGTTYDDNDLFPYMWNDVHEMAVSTSFVTSNSGDPMYMMTNPEKIPLIRLETTSIEVSD